MDRPRLCVIGVGLIGGSLARSARARGLVGEIVGCGHDEGQLRQALALGVIDRYQTQPEAAVAGADLVVLAVPVGAMGEICRRIHPHLDPAAVVTDVGSVKEAVIDQVRAAVGAVPARFVPGHPIAGTEKSGVAASFDGLFDGRCTILTPLPETDPAATAQVRALWAGVGAQVVEMDPRHHDEVLAATSHLPHLLAYGLVDMLARMEEHREIFRYAAGGFRDFTRIASSDPVMWRDICLHNRAAIVPLLRRFAAELEGLARDMEQGRGQALHETFARAKAARDRYMQNQE